MTPEEIQELDRWAAEVAMNFISYAEFSELEYFEKDSFYTDHHGQPYGKCQGLVRNWHPSQDANQTFMVVEKMRELGWFWIDIQSILPPTVGLSELSQEEVHEVCKKIVLWAVYFRRIATNDDSGKGSLVVDKDFKLAILKAAKSALTSQPK